MDIVLKIIKSIFSKKSYLYLTLVFYNTTMTKMEIWKLRNTIEENIDYLSTQFKTTYDILSDLNRMISFDMDHSMIFQWWINNEDSINIINELIEGKEE